MNINRAAVNLNTFILLLIHMCSTDIISTNAEILFMSFLNVTIFTERHAAITFNILPIFLDFLFSGCSFCLNIVKSYSDVIIQLLTIRRVF